jgi:hypothetical protein
MNSIRQSKKKMNAPNIEQYIVRVTHLTRIRGNDGQDVHDLGARQVARLEQLSQQIDVKRVRVGQREVLHHARVDEAGARHVNAVQLHKAGGARVERVPLIVAAQ